jgi:RNA 3'-terminal phosphate cyclase (ATP)
MTRWIEIDGSQGEGGGQILRTSLALSLVTGRPFRIEAIRSGREKPGLLRQHLTAVHAAASVSGATVAGAELGSKTLSFEPGPVAGGEFHLAVGTAGSATLVLQTVLPALLGAAQPSTLVLEGGTHNPFAPPFDFVEKTFVPVLRKMGADVTLTLDRYGFYPAGGGRFTAHVVPSVLRPLTLTDVSSARIDVRALVASLPENIARRELGVVRQWLGLDREHGEVVTVDRSAGPGNVVLIEIDRGTVIEVVTGFGIKGVGAQMVASRACGEAQAYLTAEVPVGTHLADQLLIPLALAGGGEFRTQKPTLHTVTNADVVRQFLEVPIRIDRESDDAYRITVGSRGGGPSGSRES